MRTLYGLLIYFLEEEEVVCPESGRPISLLISKISPSVYNKMDKVLFCQIQFALLEGTVGGQVFI